MYNPMQILKGIRNPRQVLLEVNRIYQRQIRGKTGIRVMDEDWDNLLILDACRYDIFKKKNSIEGKLSAVISSDSSTSGFLQYNFKDGFYSDTVYVAANPQVQRHDSGKRFHDCIRLWEDDWDDDLRTVRPEDVTDRTLKIHEKYPNKRLIVHYIQPHYPFIGETGRQIEHGSVTGDGVVANEREVRSIWDQLESGSVDREVIWQAYRENLELVLPEVERLLDGLVGKSVVTSDHGNSFGELGVYGHPGGVYLTSLVKVPWLEIEADTRKHIEEGRIQQENEDIEADVSDRLADLGYV